MKKTKPLPFAGGGFVLSIEQSMFAKGSQNLQFVSRKSEESMSDAEEKRLTLVNIKGKMV